MKTTLYRIPDKYFPYVIIKKPFHAKVNYEMNDGVVKIYDITLSPLCLTHIDNTAGMVTAMNKAIAEAERKAAMVKNNNHVDETVINAIANYIAAPHI